MPIRHLIGHPYWRRRGHRCNSMIKRWSIKSWDDLTQKTDICTSSYRGLRPRTVTLLPSEPLNQTLSRCQDFSHSRHNLKFSWLSWLSFQFATRSRSSSKFNTRLYTSIMNSTTVGVGQNSHEIAITQSLLFLRTFTSALFPMDGNLELGTHVTLHGIGSRKHSRVSRRV